MFRLRCVHMQYEWGKLGIESEVFSLVKSGMHDVVLDEEKPYAELWMGTHPSGPTHLADDIALPSYIKCFPDCLGPNVLEKFGQCLPFLFKVLSIRKALSIQAHPDMELAAKLHAKYPDVYKDPNHKPEMAIALTPFEALLGFRPVDQIILFVTCITELKAIIGSACCDALVRASTTMDANKITSCIKNAYSRLMLTDSVLVASSVEQLKSRLIKGEPLLLSATKLTTICPATLTELYIRLSTDFPNDVGCFSLFFLNYVQLNPGDAIFLEANLPHAYLSGDCIECMACSDNVVRAGLTPKFKDVDCLLQMLNYNPTPIKSLKFEGQSKRMEFIAAETTATTTMNSDQDIGKPELVRFRPPVDEFAVDKITIPPNCSSFILDVLQSASILIIINGCGIFHCTDVNPSVNKTGDETIPFTRGTVIFINSGASITVHPDFKTHDQQLLAFRAYSPIGLDSNN